MKPSIAYVKAQSAAASLAESMKYPILDTEVGVVTKSYPYHDIRRYMGVNPDITSYIQNSLNSGNKRIYFPSGTYTFNIEIIKSGIEIYGEGIGNTVLKPFTDNDLIRINSQNQAVSNITIHDVSMINQTGFTNGNGLIFTANGVKLTINDNNHVYNFSIKGFKNNLLIQDRQIYTVFENGKLLNALADNLHIETSDNVNHLDFINVEMSGAVNYGLYVKHATDVVKTLRFDHCVIQGNYTSTTGTIKSGIYLENYWNTCFDTCYIENNAQGQSDGNNIVVRGTYGQGLEISASLVWGSATAIDISCTLITGGIQSSKVIGNIKLYTTHTSSKFSIHGSENSDVTETRNTNDYRTTFNSMSPLVLNTKWIPAGGDDANNATVLFSSNTRTLSTLTGKYIGQIAIIAWTGNTLTVDQTGNIILRDASTYVISSKSTTLMLMYDGSKWREICRSTA